MEVWKGASRAPEETAALGVVLAACLRAGDVIALFGDLGAGKTTFVQGVARGLGITRPVTSPTFILINEYRSDPPLYHVDCYRFPDEASQAAGEATAVGLDELMGGDGVCVIEWAERLAALLPNERLEVKLAWGGAHERQIEISGRGERYAQIVHFLRQAGSF